MPKTLHFRSKKAYQKWLAYGHIHVRGFGKGRERIRIRGRLHRVKHRRR
jgi:ribosomal protein S11